jgi:metal-dependent HD superfamily phosphatase/phosphodiesterase
MSTDLNDLDLVSIRNLFLEEMQAYMIAVEIETPEELKLRRNRLKQIDAVLEEKKKINPLREYIEATNRRGQSDKETVPEEV